MPLARSGLRKDQLGKDKLQAVSFSRDSAPRLWEWIDQHEREEPGWLSRHHRREHKRNLWTASKHDLDIVAQVSSVECAADVGKRGELILQAAKDVDATVVIVPSLRRLGVGLAQEQLRRRLEDAGLQIVSEREAENVVLCSEPSAGRDLLLAHIAAADQYEWAVSRERLRRAHRDLHGTAEWQAVLQFIAARPDVDGEKLAHILEHRGYRTLTGRTNWTRMQVLRARRELLASNRATRLPAPSLR